ncbi:unnamed protein product [Spirodela intermedia]|nr:unnamed protein product [Spirodela intermedia]CAA6658166.1 unnamed protein product [Spirodela intermedia]
MQAFPGRVAIYSNSAGLSQYDPDSSKAKALEDSIEGVHVIRHVTKKPAGTVDEIEQYFGCSASQLIMVGDRCFTDVVYGNRNGFLTILTEPLNLSEEPLVVQLVRKLEQHLLTCWRKKGLKPLEHSLLSDWKQCTRSQPF